MACIIFLNGIFNNTQFLIFINYNLSSKKQVKFSILFNQFQNCIGLTQQNSTSYSLRSQSGFVGEYLLSAVTQRPRVKDPYGDTFSPFPFSGVREDGTHASKLPLPGNSGCF